MATQPETPPPEAPPQPSQPGQPEAEPPGFEPPGEDVDIPAPQPDTDPGVVPGSPIDRFTS
jgi:hypothetical protein